MSKKEKAKLKGSPHTLDARKVWYTLQDAITVRSEYLQALLTAPTHTKPVPHFGSDAEYREILGLEPKPERAKRKLKHLTIAGEDFNPEDLVPTKEPCKRRKRPAAGKAAPKVRSERADVVVASDDSC